MKKSRLLLKSFLLIPLLFVSGCETGMSLFPGIAAYYLNLEDLSEDAYNGDVHGDTVTFAIYPNVDGGKLFSEDIVGTCDITVKYADASFSLDTGSNWTTPENLYGIRFAFKKATEVGEMDYLEGKYTITPDASKVKVNVYNVRITSIYGHMKA